MTATRREWHPLSRYAYRSAAPVPPACHRASYERDAPCARSEEPAVVRGVGLLTEDTSFEQSLHRSGATRKAPSFRVPHVRAVRLAGDRLCVPDDLPKATPQWSLRR